MDLNNKILDFLDGTSSIEDDKVLLEQLAGDPEMLSKFKKLMALENSIQPNPEYYEPSVATSAKVFENLGFSYGTKPSAFAGLISFLTGSKVVTAIGSSVITILLISSYFYLFDSKEAGNDLAKTEIRYIEKENSNDNGKDNFNNNNNFNGNSDSNIVSASEIEKESEPEIVTKYINKTEYVTTDENGDPIKFASYNDLMDYVNSRNGDLSLVGDSDEKPNKDLVEVNRSEINNTQTNIDISGNEQFNNLSITEYSNNYQAFSKVSKGVEFSVLSGLNNNDLNGVSGNLVNFKIAYMPIRSNRLEFGVEVTRENFFQSFSERIDAQRTINYTQNPALWTLGISTRAYLFENDGFWNPYVQASGGGAITNELNFYPGMFFRSVIGTTLSPEMLPFDLNIGWQYTGLATQQNGEFFNSNNMSLIFGVNF